MSKVFGLGLSRTGTTSLNEALGLLGFRSKHFPIIMRNNSMEARIKYRLNKWGKELGMANPLFPDCTSKSSSTLDFIQPHEASFDAMTDLPVARFYQDLDRSFPESKFILTIRDEEQWLESCERFFAVGNNRFFKWQQVNTDMYGSPEYDRNLFKAALLKHQEEVMKYFENRPQDLLVLDITNGDGWSQLCPFLGINAPEFQFPKANVATS
jgi:hypothetical protein